MDLDGVAPMDFKSEFFNYLIDFAQSPEFGGEYTSIKGSESGTLGLYRLRWQNDQGVPREETILPVFLAKDKSCARANPEFFGSLILETAVECKQIDESSVSVRRNILGAMDVCGNSELANKCTTLRHPNDIVLLSSADLVQDLL